MPPGRAIGIITRAPAPGVVKTRLAAAIGDRKAAMLYSAFLRDVLLAAAMIEHASTTVFHPSGDRLDELAELLPPGATLEPEAGCDIGEIIRSAIRSLLSRGDVVALLGADSPGLPVELIEQAFANVEAGRADVAIGPAADGGYCLLAVNGDYPELFRDIAWSTPQVFQQLVERAHIAGLSVSALPAWYDVDSFQDLERLAVDLAGNVALQAPATRNALRHLRDAGEQITETQPPWNTISQTIVNETPWRTLVTDRIRTHDDAEIDYSYLQTENAVWVVPVTRGGQVVLIQQYRHPLREIIMEVPAGAGDGDPLGIAVRELKEETGGVASELVPIASYYQSPGHLTLRDFVVLALGVDFEEPEHEPTELIRHITVSLELAVDMARRGEIADSQSALAILVAEPIIRARLETLPVSRRLLE